MNLSILANTIMTATRMPAAAATPATPLPETAPRRKLISFRGLFGRMEHFRSADLAALAQTGMRQDVFDRIGLGGARHY